MKKWTLLGLMALSLPALAHPGHGDSFQAGLLHPLTGYDHLLMLMGTGLLAALTGRNLALPAASLVMMLVGALAGHALGYFPGMEQLIIASLAAIGIALAVTRTPKGLVFAVPLLTLFHGWAHGVEVSQHSFWHFTGGFMIASTSVMLVSYVIGKRLQPSVQLRQWLGGGLIATAVLALVAG